MVHDAELRVLARELVGDLAAAVGGAVVNDDDLEGPTERCQKSSAFCYRPDGPLVAVDREEEADRVGCGQGIRPSGA